MMKKTLALILVIALLVLIVGCAQKAPEAAPAAEEKTATETNVEDVATGIDEIDSIEQELNTSELDNLEQELGEVSW